MIGTEIRTGIRLILPKKEGEGGNKGEPLRLPENATHQKTDRRIGCADFRHLKQTREKEKEFERASLT